MLESDSAHIANHVSSVVIDAFWEVEDIWGCKVVGSPSDPPSQQIECHLTTFQGWVPVAMGTDPQICDQMPPMLLQKACAYMLRRGHGAGPQLTPFSHVLRGLFNVALIAVLRSLWPVLGPSAISTKR